MKISKSIVVLANEVTAVKKSGVTLTCPVDKLIRSGEAKIVSSSGHGITFTYGGQKLSQTYEDNILEIYTGQEWKAVA